MKRTAQLRILLGLLPIGLVLSALCSCGYLSTHHNREADSLNRLSYGYHYKNLDSVQLLATQAYSSAGGDVNAKAEALNNLAFYAFMRMDFEQSANLLAKVYDACNNELELLIADIGMMKICQRTAANKEFYDHRNSALSRMRHIDEERSALSESEQQRFTYAQTEFHIVSSIYYYYLQQEEQSLEEINLVDPIAAVEKDTAQLLYYYYMKGSGGLCPGKDESEIAVREFDYLSKCIALSHECGYVYFEANCLQAYAELLINDTGRKAIEENRKTTLKLLNTDEVADSLLPINLAGKALQLFMRYGDDYQIAGTYRTIATCQLAARQYTEAIISLQQALDYVSKHHERYYDCTDSTHRLSTYCADDTLCLEKRWLTDKRIQTVPEWIARIREQLCLAYSGLGMKRESDYNRNIYLDILDVTRQDKELESRYDLLEAESRQLNFWLFTIVALLVVTLPLFWWLNKRWKRNNAEQIENLKLILEICRKITASLPAKVMERDDIGEYIREAVRTDLTQLFGPCEVSVDLDSKRLQVQTDHRLNREQQTTLNVLAPYVAWAIENGSTLLSLDEEQQSIETERYIHQQHIADNKRQNIVKKACFAILTGITPYLDRIIHEVNKLKSLPASDCSADNYELRRKKYVYIAELTDKINEYNDILSAWIKMKQGSLALNIGNFQLNDLFDIIRKGRKKYEAKGQTFTVEPTPSVVKADKALTLFMLNTLAENARKYTPDGGTIAVYARETDTYVEISVKDNGIGLSADDLRCLLEEKVYNPDKRGMDDSGNREMLHCNKGNGFGLMNCKGIIEKYRKTNALFSVCAFSIESEKGKGSRFFFRLPKGVAKSLTALLLLLLPMTGMANDVSYYDASLEVASRYADSVYFSNVNGRYADAIQFVDSAIVYLNKHHRQYSKETADSMALTGQGEAAEITWWYQLFDTDYHVILDIRNEAAVAALALNDWDTYRYNNLAYTRLYKLLGEDSSLEEYCKEMQRSSTNKTVSIVLCLLILLILASAYYLLYFRRRILYRLNLEQVLEINLEIVTSSMSPMRDSDEMDALPQRILQSSFASMNDLFDLRSMGLAVYDEAGKKLHYAVYPSSDHRDELCAELKRCYEEQSASEMPEKGTVCLPLTTELQDEEHCLGAFVLVRNRMDSYHEDERLMVRLIAKYLSVVVMNVVVRMNSKYRDIELARDEKTRTLHEENQIYVQNQVLDNCLSAVKHETLYYPNRIKQIAERLLQPVNPAEELEQTAAMEELVSYYKDVFTILCSCASRQLEEVTFKRTTIQVADLMAHAQKYLSKLNRKRNHPLTLHTEACALRAIGDEVLLKFLLENLIGAACASAEEGSLRLTATEEAGFVRFGLSDSRGVYTEEELNSLFYPDRERMRTDEAGRLTGTEYLLCKQIVRDHDEYTGLRGCRMNAEPQNGGGFTIWFTIPRKP